MADKIICDKSDLTAIADAIRAKTESVDTMSIDEMVTAIEGLNIAVVGDTSAAVAYTNISTPDPYPSATTPYTLTLTCDGNTLTGSYTTAGQSITYALPAVGTWSGSFTDSNGDVLETFTFDIVPFIYDKNATLANKHVLADDDWATISELSQSGSPEMYYTVGDEKDITLTTGETITLQIIGFNHDVLSDGAGYAGITFQMKYSLKDMYSMNSGNTNVGGWPLCLMRTRLQPGGEIYNTLPDDVKAVIRPVDKITCVDTTSTPLQTTSDYAFLLSETEIFGSSTYSATVEGSRYDYYKNYANTGELRIKRLANGTGSKNGWWERSAYLTYTQDFCRVKSSGEANSYYAGYKNGVSFAFCV